MNFLKSLWCKLFPVKTGVYNSRIETVSTGHPLMMSRDAYDPHEDEMKIMNGEVESYFE